MISLKKYSPIFSLSFILPFILFSTISCQESHFNHIEGMVWNTVYHVSFNGNPSLGDSILPLLDKVSKSLSVFDNNSLVNKLNLSDSVIADAYLLEIYDKSCQINLLSEGNFDPTVSPLVDAWGFGVKHTVSSDTTAIDSILNFVGIGKTFRRDSVIYKNDIRTRFNFSAIAKGFGCDEISRMFLNNGINDFMIEIGGEVVVHGKSPSGKDWRIAIDAPVENSHPGQEPALVLSLTDKGIATSGNYRNFRSLNGKLSAHTISPLTGRPFFSEILSATIIASSCMEADALATACMASSPDLAKQIIKKYSAEGLLIFKDSIWMSPGFSAFVISEVSEPGKTIQN